MAQEIGMEFARRVFGDKYQVVVSTHLDKGHLHNHLLINSVSFIDGKKYKSEFNTYYNQIRRTSDEICKEYNLSIIAPSIDSKSLTYIEWLEINQGKTTWQSIIRSDIDYAISTSYSFGEFIMDMEHMGYEVKHGKYLAVRPYNKDRFTRCYNLGKSYSEDEIRARIAGGKSIYIAPVKMEAFRKKLNARVPIMPDFIKQYWRRMYTLNLVKKHKAPPRVSKYLRKDLQAADRYKEQFRFLKTHNLGTESQFNNYVKQLDEKIDELSSKLHSFDNTHKKDKNLYNTLADIEKYKKPYELYLQGYTMMIKEYNYYIKAEQLIKNSGYNIQTLKEKKINVYGQRDAIKKDLQYYRNEKRICSNIQKTTDYIKEQSNQMDKQQTISKKKEIEKER